MLRITTQREVRVTTLELEGKLAGPWVAELEQCWREATATSGSSAIRVYLRAVSYIDAAGKQLLAQMYQQGVELVAVGCLTRAVVEDIAATSVASTSNLPSGSAAKKTLAVVLLLASLAIGRDVRAEEKPAVQLTLREVIALALKQNPQVQIAILNLAQSRQDKAIALSALLPQANLEASDAAVRNNLETSLGRRIPGLPQHVGPFQVFQAGPQFGMPVFDLTLWRRWQASQQGVRSSEAQHQSVREQIVLLVVSQYLSCLRAGADVRAAESRVDLAQALYDQAADLQKHGVGTGIDTLRANVQLQNEKQRLIVSETQQKTALYGLVRLLNLDPQQTIGLADELSFFETPEFHAEESLERAYASRPEMRALDARERAAYYQKRAASESRLPAVRFGGDWYYQGVSTASAIPVYQYQVGLEMPLFTSGRIHAEVARADLELKKISQERSELRNQIALEVKTAKLTLESARHEVTVANLGVKLAQEEMTQARDRFEAGVANNIEVITAQDALARANDNQIAALYRYNQARADLARSIGQMELLYAK